MTGIWSGIDNPDIEMDVLRDLGDLSDRLPGWAERALILTAEFGILIMIAVVVLLTWLAVRRGHAIGPAAGNAGAGAGAGAGGGAGAEGQGEAGGPTGAASLAAPAGVLWAVLSAGIAYLVNVPIRDFVARPRPEDHIELAELDPLLDGADGYSFVSDHSSVAMAVAVALLLVHRRLGLVAFVLALLQGVGRVLVGVHYPTDVIGGFALGTATALLLAPLALAGLVPMLRWCGRTRGLRWLTATPPEAPTSAPARQRDLVV